jgi:hypothetical protein
VLENRALRKICEGEYRRLHNEELYALYSAPNISQVIKRRRIRWVGYVARVGDRRRSYRVLVGKEPTWKT